MRVGNRFRDDGMSSFRVAHNGHAPRLVSLCSVGCRPWLGSLSWPGRGPRRWRRVVPALAVALWSVALAVRLLALVGPRGLGGPVRLGRPGVVSWLPAPRRSAPAWASRVGGRFPEPVRQPPWDRDAPTRTQAVTGQARVGVRSSTAERLWRTGGAASVRRAPRAALSRCTEPDAPSSLSAEGEMLIVPKRWR